MNQKKEAEKEHIAAENKPLSQEEEMATAQQKEENPENQDKHASAKNLEADENQQEAENAAENEEEPELDPGKTAVGKLEQELAEQKDKYLRMYSEFENYRRRTAREKLDMIKTANESMATALLPVLDDFERAIKALEAEEAKLNEAELAQASKGKEGILLIYHKFKKALEQKGITEMEIKVGDDFDADFQEAITQIPAPEEKLKGKVVDVVEKGFTLGEKVIRFAKVVIGA